jgi:ATP-dependent DNA ligase
MIGETGRLAVSRITASRATALGWLGLEGLDGVMAKNADEPYRPGKRAMRKFKLRKTIDCVVGGIYRNAGSGEIESLLLGLYGGDGKLNYVGRVPTEGHNDEFAAIVEPMVGGEGFTGRAPGGRSRWSGKLREPVPLRPVLVAEVSADQITAGQMRHAARFIRWRTDKPARECTMDQIGG